MLKLDKTGEPSFFKSWVNKNKKEPGAGVRLREFILENEQQGVCCYCEKGVSAHGDDSLIEHIRPQDTFPNLKNDYRNLAVSCKTRKQCGNAKGNTFNDNFIVPTEEDPGNHLTYSGNGEIMPIKRSLKGAETIAILNLNDHKLVGARRTLLKKLDDMRALDNFEQYFREYPTFIRYFKENFV